MNNLNIIAFDIPYPADYGGAIDIYYKLKAFKETGVHVHLQCFRYSRDAAPELEQICASVNYYKRHVSKTHLFNLKPYIVISRASEQMIKNISENDYPVLFEGLHCCYYLGDKRIRSRRKIVRAHNIEHNYYYNLAKSEKSIFRKYYFFNEASKLKRFEQVYENADGIAAISPNDKAYFSQKYKNVRLISAFHPHNRVNIQTGKGDYVLYHGSLDVNENNQAALFLVKNVFNDLDVKLIIAGNKPSSDLKQSINGHGNIRLLDNITTNEIYELVKNAQINILPTFQATGIKLKLLAALHTGRHCLVNSYMVKNTGLEDLCIIKENPADFKAEIKRLMDSPFTREDIVNRENILYNKGFSNNNNIYHLIDMLFQ